MRQKKIYPDIKCLDDNWNYSGAVEIEYDSVYSCNDYKDDEDRYYNCNPYCRCRVIENARATTFNINALSEKVVGKNPNGITAYCVDRLIHNVLANQKPEDIFEVHAEAGYYGEEIGSVEIAQNFADALKEKITAVQLFSSDGERLIYVLREEYGHILPSIQKVTQWRIVNVSFDEIILGQSDHYKKLNQDIVAAYVDHPLPRGICLADGKKYKLVDGYHRVAATEKRQRKTKFPIIVGEII